MKDLPVQDPLARQTPPIPGPPPYVGPASQHVSAPSYWTAPPLPDPRRTAMWAHLGALLMDLGGLLTCGITSLLLWIPPLVIHNGRSAGDPFVRRHARQALNFAFTELLAVLVLLVLFAVAAPLAVPLTLAVCVTTVVLRIIAATAANRGEPYVYPLAIPFLS
ncbi:DUF4870 domain-containing protein [Microbispora sp. NPDC088329]|uniref:DUF4870 domain-containing protein n=1 Tax=Microbispora sp. NPDC088329 TaxID=3154869 RepID=UPI00342D010C